MVFSPRQTPVFLLKRPKSGPFFLSVRFYEGGKDPVAIDGEPLARFFKMTLFLVKIIAPRICASKASNRKV